MDEQALYYRRNFVAILGDAISFGLALTFANATTTLPDFVSHLTPSQIVVGLFSSVYSGAWLLPQILYARFLNSRRRKKPYILLGATIGRPFYLFYAAALWLGLLSNSLLALVLFFALQVLFLGSDALAAVAWFDLYAKAIPENRRGRLIGLGQSIRGVLAIAAGALIAALLGDWGPPFPRNYAAIFALSGSCLLLSLLSVSFVREPDEPIEERQTTWREYLPELLATVRRDLALRRLLAIRLLAGFDSLALSFYILFATQKLGLPPETVGVYTVVQTVTGIAASLGLGLLSERVGNHRVVQVATAVTMTAPLVGLMLFLSGASATPAAATAFGWTFVAIGTGLSAIMLGYFNYVLDLAPAGQRPTYVGIFNTVSGALIALPPLGGLLLQKTSYGVLFAVTAAMQITAHVLSWKLPRVHHATDR